MGESAISGAGLAGTTWTLKSYGPAGSPTPAAPRPAVLRFGTDGRVSGSTGCNNVAGGYTSTAAEVTFGPLAMTRRACSEPLASQEQAVARLLSGTLRYTVAGERLTLHAADGASALVFTAGESVDAAAGGAEVRAQRVTGSVLYRERMMLPPGAALTVQLLDTSRMDVPAEVLAEQVITLAGGPPYPFELRYDPQRIDERHTYALRAQIHHDGQLLFTSAEAHHVITGGRPSTAEIMVRRARPEP